MKAININLDPYLAAFAAWLKGGKSGPAPTFSPLPLAVTIPLGETAAILAVGKSDGTAAGFMVGDIEVVANAAPYGDPPEPPSGESVVTANYAAGLSAFPSGETFNTQYYQVFTVSGESVSQNITICDTDDNVLGTIPFTVLVRRETAQGPVDLVDFTPPAAAPTAADIKSELVAAGNGALEGVDIGGTTIDGAENVLRGVNSSTVRREDEVGYCLGYGFVNS